jgi:hypothetical protein
MRRSVRSLPLDADQQTGSPLSELWRNAEPECQGVRVLRQRKLDIQELTPGAGGALAVAESSDHTFTDCETSVTPGKSPP